jgi:hypothetical protein
VITAVFTLSDLTVTPTTVKPGGEATASVRVFNTGAAEGAKTVPIKVNDKDAGQKDIALAAGRSGEVSFKVSSQVAGHYTVTVENLSAGFDVIDSPSPTAASPSTGGTAQSPDLAIPILIIIAMGGLLVIVLVIILVTRRRVQ